ncbi:PREDICTED: pentatricopeptide repeat-containing protein At4g35850, mitochondrial-like isoform X3 [Nicotiana attenuata]|uniref:pentatricopeptide repeat-containing protein At4g35850, mitochondrial-like isoform X3 n=1 Tax=Nicotiana attenuata TaxID=49451 RepID=UPI0009046389|nr:PREDICTED: pentatricopeptide repeat-containing protein At4g35850, mitochondrial-like isoform X3 [Nicotiana attenuata]
MKLLPTLSGPRNLLVRTLGRRYFAVTPEEYAKRNYANNEAEYSTVIISLTAQRRHYLLRDVYDDMMPDGVKPERDTLHSLLIGTMKGAHLQDAFFFRDEMKTMGLVPDLLEEMKRFEVKPTGQTYICLLNACAAAGQVDRVYAIVSDMTAAGLGLNKFCYAELIAAHKNKEPVTDDVASKILELVEQSKVVRVLI